MQILYGPTSNVINSLLNNIVISIAGIKNTNAEDTNIKNASIESTYIKNIYTRNIYFRNTCVKPCISWYYWFYTSYDTNNYF